MSARPLNELLRRYIAIRNLAWVSSVWTLAAEVVGTVFSPSAEATSKPTAAVSGFRKFIDRQAFEITLITALPQKARRLAESMSALRDARVSMIKVVAMPELLNLIAPPAY